MRCHGTRHARALGVLAISIASPLFLVGLVAIVIFSSTATTSIGTATAATLFIWIVDDSNLLAFLAACGILLLGWIFSILKGK